MSIESRLTKIEALITDKDNDEFKIMSLEQANTIIATYWFEMGYTLPRHNTTTKEAYIEAFSRLTTEEFDQMNNKVLEDNPKLKEFIKTLQKRSL